MASVDPGVWIVVGMMAAGGLSFFVLWAFAVVGKVKGEDE